MKITLETILKSVDALRELSSLKFKAIHAFSLAKLLKVINQELEIFSPIQREAMLKYSTDGKSVDSDKLDDAHRELAELKSKEVEVPETSLSLSDLETLDISASLIMQSEWLFQKEQSCQ
jgi:hypothetical protein